MTLLSSSSFFFAAAAQEYNSSKYRRPCLLRVLGGLKALLSVGICSASWRWAGHRVSGRQKALRRHPSVKCCVVFHSAYPVSFQPAREVRATTTALYMSLGAVSSALLTVLRWRSGRVRCHSLMCPATPVACPSPHTRRPLTTVSTLLVSCLPVSGLTFGGTPHSPGSCYLHPHRVVVSEGLRAWSTG